MIDEIKILLGDAASNYTEAQIKVCLKHAQSEVVGYCGKELDEELEMAAERIAIIKLNRLNSEGLAGQSFSGVSETYVDGYPADIQALLDRKKVRKIKVL